MRILAPLSAPYNHTPDQSTMTTEQDTQQAVQRFLDFEAALTPVVINRLVKSGAMTPTHADELKASYRKKQARKHARIHQTKKHRAEIAKLQQTEVSLVSKIGTTQQVVRNLKIKMDAATHHYAQFSAELSTQEECLAAVRRRISKLQAKVLPSAIVPSPAAPVKNPKPPKKKKNLRKHTPYNMFVKLESAAIRAELGDAAKLRGATWSHDEERAWKSPSLRGATMKVISRRWKALDASGRAFYKTAVDQHNAKIAETHQQTT